MIYKIVKRNVPSKEGRVNKYYAQAVTAGRSTLQMIVDKIEDRCTVTRPDILAVVAALVDDVFDRLQSGHIVEMGELGNMQLTIHNKRGSETEEDWTADLIKKAVITYRPSQRMRKAAESVGFNRWSKPTQSTQTPETGA